MRPRYAFDTKKPTKSASYQKPTDFYSWSQNVTRINSSEKAASLHSETASNENNNKLKN